MVLETAIGMAFVFLLVSLLVTASSEMIANAMGLRARCLKKGLEDMLAQGNPTDAALKALPAEILQHPLVAGGVAAPAADAKEPAKGSGPSYIPSQVFSSALLDTLGLVVPGAGAWSLKLEARLAALPANGWTLAPLQSAVAGLLEELTEALDGADLRSALEKVAAAFSQNPAELSALQKKLAEINAQISAGQTLNWVKPTLTAIEQNPTARDLHDLIAQIPSTGAGAAAFQNRLRLWRDKLPQTTLPYALALEGAKALTGSITDMHAALQQLPDSKLKQTLQLLYREAGEDAAIFKTKVGDWFDASMNHVSGWYKRRTAWVNFSLGVLLAVLLNVDALLVLQRLTTDPSLRSSLVEEASAYAKQAADAPGTDKTTPPAGTTPTMAEARNHYDEAHKNLEDLGLPIGWITPGTSAAQRQRATNERRVYPMVSGLLTFRCSEWTTLFQIIASHWIGWLLTGIAASLGAPFWFDLLSKFMNVRQTGKRPENTPPLAS